jgi:hypothetical protein
MTGITNPNLMFGVRVHVVPDFFTVARTWRERLFSWPWRPRQAFRRVENQMVPPKTTLIVQDPRHPFDPVFVVRESEFENLRRKLIHSQAYELEHPGEESFKPEKPH